MHLQNSSLVMFMCSIMTLISDDSRRVSSSTVRSSEALERVEAEDFTTDDSFHLAALSLEDVDNSDIVDFFLDDLQP